MGLSEGVVKLIIDTESWNYLEYSLSVCILFSRAWYWPEEFDVDVLIVSFELHIVVCSIHNLLVEENGLELFVSFSSYLLDRFFP